MQGGIYRDDALSIIPSKTVIERMQKNIRKFFKSFNQGLTVVYTTTLVNFLDATLDINSGLYYPYRKLDEVTKCVNKSSNPQMY